MSQRTPRALKVLRGETRPSRLQPEIEVTTGLPVKPTNLSEAGSVIWDRAIEDLGASGVLTRADSGILAAYVEVEAKRAMDTASLSTMTSIVRSRRDGGDTWAANPLFRVVRDETYLALRLARELGMTPASRAAFRPGEDDGDELDRWMRS